MLLTRQGGGVDRAASAERYTRILGNVTFLERPFHPTTLVSLVRTALRGRMRQYEARAQIEERERIAAELAAHRSRLQEMVAERTRALEEANRQLVAEAAERERTEARLHQAQKMEAVGQLIGGVAHDFNNLLAAIVGNLELIQARAPEVRIRRWASNALQAAERGAKLTGQMLAFSRMQRLELGPVDANALIEGMRSLIERSLGPGIELGLALDPTVGPAVADENQLSVLEQRYPHFFAPYRSTRSFVLGLNGIIHPEGRKLYLGAETPNFDWEEEPDGSLLMGYHSSRRMCSFAQGMVEGSAKVFGEDVRVEHVRCFHRGDPDCVLRLGFGRTPAA